MLVQDWCNKCGDVTYQKRYKDYCGSKISTFDRVVLAVGSLGTSELVYDTVCVCYSCGNKKTV